MTQDDSGSAFPIQDGTWTAHCGLTMRDYFAAQALPAIIRSTIDWEGPVPYNWMQVVAGQAYEMADEMLEARRL